MTAFPWKIGPTSATRSCAGFFLKLLEAPSADMTLLDVSAGVNGYWRYKVTHDLTISLEVSLSSGGNSLNGIASLAGGTASLAGLQLGTWVWISGDQGNGHEINLALTQPGGGIAVQRVTSSTSAPATDTTFAVSVGWGATLSGGTPSGPYLNFPADVTKGEMSKLWFSHGASAGSNTGLPMPTVDPPGTSGQDVVALYLCRETPGGGVATLFDAGTGLHHLQAVGSLVVSGDGPFLS